MHSLEGSVRIHRADDQAQLFSNILACSSRENIVADILAPLCRHVEASSAVFLQYIRHDGQTYVGHGDTFAIPRQTLDDYSSTFFHLDPISVAALRLADSRGPFSQPLTISLEDVADIKKLRNSFYYNEFLRPIGIGHVLAAFVPIRTFDNEIMLLGLHRPADMKPFDREDAKWLEFFRPAISSVLTNFSLQAAFSCANTAISAMSSGETPIGLVIMDDQFMVVHANPKGLTDLGLMKSGPDERLKEIIRSANATKRRGPDIPTVLTFGDTGNLTVTINRATIPGAGNRLVITTAQSSIKNKMIERSQTFDFSAREMQIAQLIATGLANENIAHQLGISTRTVENHLRAIYLKAGVNSRTQLVARMITL
jgi:DNA-binding NarL/FixJ family response regulator